MQTEIENERKKCGRKKGVVREHLINKKEFGIELEKAGLTRKELCENLGVTYTTFNNSWGSNKAIPKYAISYVKIYQKLKKCREEKKILEKYFELKKTENKKNNSKDEYAKKIKELKLSRDFLCEEFGVTKQSISNWLNSSATPLWFISWLNVYEEICKYNELRKALECFSSAK
ncbi:hypothetical protein IP364_03985 [Helicobacter winghamensis]|uniref:hypothetical protein n=1 Tax=Helicobacter winghamensis TaxID=157268 RepID=UPI0027AA00AF